MDVFKLVCGTHRIKILRGVFYLLLKSNDVINTSLG